MQFILFKRCNFEIGMELLINIYIFYDNLSVYRVGACFKEKYTKNQYKVPKGIDNQSFSNTYISKNKQI